MRILMRNTVFKTAALAGLFSCMLALVGAFSGITASVHAMHEGFIHADDVDTEAEKLKEFVEEAVDEYYIEFLIKERCDFRKLLEGKELQIPIEDFLPMLIRWHYYYRYFNLITIRMLSTDDVKQLDFRS